MTGLAAVAPAGLETGLQAGGPQGAGGVADGTAFRAGDPGAFHAGSAAAAMPVGDVAPASGGGDLAADFLRHVDDLSSLRAPDGVGSAEGAGRDGMLFHASALSPGDPQAVPPPAAPKADGLDAMKDVIEQAEHEMRADMVFSVNANMLSTSSQSVSKTRDDLMKQG